MDWRAKLTLKSTNTGLYFPELDGPLSPLRDAAGIVFPYTLQCTSGAEVKYENKDYTHTNYRINAFQKAEPKDITISAKFSASSIEEARYVHAVIVFLRTITRSSTANDRIGHAGAPPPILLFNYLGDLFSDVPVYVKTYSFSLPDNVDYVQVNSDIVVPTMMELSLTLGHSYNVDRVLKQFSFKGFASGELLNQGYH